MEREKGFPNGVVDQLLPSRIQFASPSRHVCTSHPMIKRTPAPGTFLVTSTPRDSLPPILSLDHGNPVQATNKEQGGPISVLNGFIEVFNLAKEISSNTPAKAIFGSANIILAMIRVSLPGFRLLNTDSLSRMGSGHNGQRSQLRRTWAGMRRSLRHSQAGTRQEERRWPQRLGAEGNRTTEKVSRTTSTL